MLSQKIFVLHNLKYLTGVFILSSHDLLNKVKNIYLIGIGGSGMCSIAEILISKGYNISGSDSSSSDTLDRVKSWGIPVFLGHSRDNIKNKNIDLIVYSAAIKEDNIEILEAKEKNIKCIERSVMLGLITKKYKNAIAVCGTHGKTTTTSMITQIFMDLDFDPTAIVGGHLPAIGGNSLIGKSETIICEACEYVDTFLQLHPRISVILNIEADHLDYFKNLQGVKRSFKKFASQTSDLLVVNGDDENVKIVCENLSASVITFGFNKGNDYTAQYLEEDKTKRSFKILKGKEEIAIARLKVPGIYNIYNALAAIVVAHKSGGKIEKIIESISKFTGANRRFQILGEVNGITVADDFAHHPTELKMTLTAAKDMNFKRVLAVFQPHTYSRTYAFLNEFSSALSIADKVVLSEILAVREKNVYNIYAKDLANKIEGCTWFKTFEEITEHVVKEAKQGDLVITLGGGDVYKCARMIFNAL